jgi:hypothetical protein
MCHWRGFLDPTNLLLFRKWRILSPPKSLLINHLWRVRGRWSVARTPRQLGATLRLHS